MEYDIVEVHIYTYIGTGPTGKVKNKKKRTVVSDFSQSNTVRAHNTNMCLRFRNRRAGRSRGHWNECERRGGGGGRGMDRRRTRESRIIERTDGL